MINFCTLFDYNFLPAGLAMYESLAKYCRDFHLYIFALDDRSFDILTKLDLSHTTIISRTQFEDRKLLQVKSQRTWIEYCWTCTSSTLWYVLNRYPVASCTYLDADIYFFSSPKILFNEIGKNSVLITEHRYTEDRSTEFGKYCVQFVTVKNDRKGRYILNWWRTKTIDWCYARVEKTRFGDQKYLDDWPARFGSVRVLQHLGGGVAPWNVQQYEIIKRNSRIFGLEKSSKRLFKLIFYHFAALRFYQKEIVQLASSYELSNSAIDLLYKPYIHHLDTIRNTLRTVDPSIIFSYSQSPGEPEFLKWFQRKLLTEFVHLAELFSLKIAISRFRLNNIYYIRKLIEQNFQEEINGNN